MFMIKKTKIHHKYLKFKLHTCDEILYYNSIPDEEFR